MEHYKLQDDEVVLYQTNVFTFAGIKGRMQQFILTNHYMVIIVKRKISFRRKEIFVEKYSTDDIKVYNDAPQIRQQWADVEIYLKGGNELKITFAGRGEARKFTGKVVELITGKTKFQRILTKSKDTVETIEDSLGIDAVKSAKSVATGVASGLSAKGKFGTVKKVLGLTKHIGIKTTNTTKTKALSTSEQLESLKQLKELLDAGVITQEEFDNKKKEILG